MRMLHKSKASVPFCTLLYLFLLHTVCTSYLLAIFVYILLREFSVYVHLFFKWSFVWYGIIL